MPVPLVAPVTVSLLSAQEDLASLETLVRHLAPLCERERMILWNRQMVRGGEKWEQTVAHHLQTDELVILLLSADLFASEHFQSYVAMVSDRWRKGEAVLLPLLVRPCRWQETDLRVVPVLPRTHQAISSAPHPEVVWVEMVEEISQIVQEIRSRRSANSVSVSLEPRNPYKGLHSFAATDATDFFGRETFLEELSTTLEQQLAPARQHGQAERLFAVVGVSGSGKSSVVHAGLLPRLQQGAVSNSQEWVYLAPIVPGNHPLEVLAVSLAEQTALEHVVQLHQALNADSSRTLHLLSRQLVGTSSARKVVLFIDQFEEVFTLTTSEEERTHFFDLLVTATTEPDGPLLVVLTLRADFYAHALSYPTLHRLIDAHHAVLFPMSMDQLRAVIEQPARLPDVQLTFEPDLVGDMLFETREQPGGLPLLEFTLEQLFARRQGQRLTRQAYREIGGVKGAVTSQAEATYMALPSATHRQLVRQVFLRLINLGATEQERTRRRAVLAEFETGDPAQTRIQREIIDAFVQARLLTTSEEAGVVYVEVSHEALLREWPRLTDWLQEAREDVLLQQKLSNDVREWQEQRHSRDLLYRGKRLRTVRQWARRNRLNQQEALFLRASRQQRMQVQASILLVILLLTATAGSALWFFTQRTPDTTRVTNTQNDGVGSLRWVIANAPSGSTIHFAAGLAGQTITLTDTLVIAAKQLTIQGLTTGKQLTIANASHGIAVVESEASVTMSDLTFLGGSSNTNALLTNKGHLTLSNCLITGNRGGGVENDGYLYLSNCTIAHNTAKGLNNDGTVIMMHTSISDNNIIKSGDISGGGIANSTTGKFTMIDSIVSNNSATSYSSNNRFPAFTHGSGIYNNGSMSITGSAISGNSILGGRGRGAGIYNGGEGSMSITGSTISGNSTLDGSGAGIFNYGEISTRQ